MFEENEEEVPVGGGLNAGAELDHEDIFEEIVPGQVPELKKDISIFVSLEERIQDLFYLAQEIESAGGMCQGFALEAERILPDFNANTPLGFYTKLPSATRLRPSMEAISNSIWALIAAAAAAVIAAIVKFVQWFREKDKDPTKEIEEKIAKSQANEAALHMVDEKSRDLRDIMQGGHTRLNGGDEPGKPVTMQNLIDDIWGGMGRFERAKRFLDIANPIHNDIIYRGKYTQAFRSITPTLTAVTDVLRQKLRILVQISATDQGSFRQIDKSLNMRALEAVKAPLEIRFNGGMRSLSDVADAMGNLRQAAATQHIERPMQFDQFNHAVLEAYKASQIGHFFHEQRNIVEVFEDLDLVLKDLQKHAGDASTDGRPHGQTEGVGPALREVIFAVGKDVNAYRRLFAELSTYGAYLERLASETVGFAIELEQHLVTMARHGKITVPDDWIARASKRRPGTVERVFTAK